MSLTDIGNRKTPSTPLELTFGSQPLASGSKIATLFGHMAASGSTGASGQILTVLNTGDPVAAKTEVDAIAGTGSEAGKMAFAFVQANAVVTGRNFAPFRIVLLANGDAAFGAADAALAVINSLRSDFLVNPYEASASTTTNKLRDKAVYLSGIDRDMQGQFGTTVVTASIVAAATLAAGVSIDHLNVVAVALPDTDGSPTQSIGEIAAAAAGVLCQHQFPYYGLNGEIIGGLAGPTLAADRVEVGPASASEQLLAKGFAPLYVDAQGNVRFVRTILTRITTDGTTPATAYIDWQDVQVLYEFKEQCYNLIQQPQFKNKKASDRLASLLTDEVIRLAFSFEKDEAFQNVKESAKQFQIAPSTSSRGRFDFKIPLDVTPNLMVTAGNIQATVFTL